jgi:hypothetical protein
LMLLAIGFAAYADRADTQVRGAPMHEDEESGWSEVSNGLKARIRLNRIRRNNGSGIIASYLELENVTGGQTAITLAWSY